MRRSHQKKDGTAPIHMISAFAARQYLVFGQVKVADKSNEIGSCHGIAVSAGSVDDQHLARHPAPA